MYIPDEFDFVKLAAAGKDNPADGNAARVAVLGFCTTQYYAAVLRGLGSAAGYSLTTYEPEYNTVHQVVLDERSPLYSFEPDFVVFLTAVQAFRNLLLSSDVTERVDVAQREVEELSSLVRRAAQIPGATVVVYEFVVPYERAWGNYSSQVDGSLPNVVRTANDRIRALAAEVPNVYTIDTDHIASWNGKRSWFDERLWFYSKSSCHPEALPQVAGEAVDIFRAVKGKSLKCIALDLDNVLWGGVIGDDGLNGIRLGDLGEGEAFVQFQLWLRELRARGIMLAVCSKNDEAKALEPFQKHKAMVLREEDISCFVANWTDKAENLRRIAERLNIGLDAIVFVDDSPFERNLVRELVPEVCVPEMPAAPADYVPYLESLNLFEAVQFSEEDRKRADFYRANLLREDAQAKFTSIDEYLAGLEMEAIFERFDDAHMPRITQLVQRTNQFNLTTVRHSADELAQFADDPDYFPFYATLEDRFGDNGLISVVIGKRDGDDLELVTWLMSCRVISRRMEEFVLDELVDVAKAAGVEQLIGRYIPTDRNDLVAKHYERLGFEEIEENPDGRTTWRLSLADYEPSDAPIERKAFELEA
jgi:FkbH-like protein